VTDGSPVSRRQLLRTVGIGATVALAGCSTGRDGSQQQTETETQQSYRYYFQDTADTLGGAGRVEVPEDATDTQVVVNTRTAQEWRTMQVNDHNYARRILDKTTIPEVKGIDEIPPEQIDDEIREIEQSVLDVYESRTSGIEDDSAEIFTESMLAGIQGLAFDSGGPTNHFGVKHLAEYIVENNEQIEIHNYKLSPVWSRIGDAGRGFSHPVGLVQWDEDGDSKTRYAEVENRKTKTVVKPEESVYTADLDAEDFGTPYLTDNPDPGDWTTAFEYSKLRELQQRGELQYDNDRVDELLVDALIGNIDGARTFKHMHGDEEQFDVKTGVEAQYGGEDDSLDEYVDAIVSDSFGESFESYLKSPESEYTRDDFETATRAIFSAYESQEFTGGIGIDGTIAQPEIFKLTKEQVEQIRESGDYTDVSSVITG
jgi:hypothetical protein